MIPTSILLSFIAVLLGIFGAYKAIKAARKKNGSIKTHQISTEDALRISISKNTANDVLKDFGKQKLLSLYGPVRDFITYFSSFINVECDDSKESEECDGKFTPDTLAELDRACRMAVKILSAGKTAIGGRTLAAFGAYSGAITPSAAGIGCDAIKALNGVSSTNAAIAWLDGEALAAGEPGNEKDYIYCTEAPLICTRLSQIIQTVNLLAIPVLKILVERLQTSNTPLKIITREFSGIQNALHANKILTDHNHNVFDSKIDWHQLSKAQQNDVNKAAKAALLLKTFLDISLLNEEGSLAEGVQNRLEEIQVMAIDHESLARRIGNRI